MNLYTIVSSLIALIIAVYLFMKIRSLESSINKINNNMITTDSYIRIMDDPSGCRSMVKQNDDLKLDHGGPSSSANCSGKSKWYIQKYY